MDRRLPIPQMLIIMGTVTSLTYLVIAGNLVDKGEISMNEVSIVSLIVAVLGAATGIWAQVVQFKRDSGKVDRVDSSVGGVKSDTAEIKPKVGVIQEDVKKVRDEVVEKIVPNLGKLSGLDELVDEMKYQKRLKGEISTNLTDPDYMVAGILSLYEDNSKLMKRTYELERKNQELTRNHVILKRELDQARVIIRKYEREQDMGIDR